MSKQTNDLSPLHSDGAPEQNEKPRVREQYRAPKLTVCGTVEDLTRGLVMGADDGFGGTAPAG